ncbi:MAG: multifunctional folylpolyglutamate synthase/dihydrofolate synthase, partial [uncultured bacterium]
MFIKNFTHAEAFLSLHIPKTSAQTFPGETGLNRAKNFLRRLGNPQEKLKIIHVAGTSGKGSTCYLISSLLSAHGFKVGLHQSPHLTDVTERFQINNKNISKDDFVVYLNKIIPIINHRDEACLVSTSLTYFEILVGMAFYIFNEKKVDYAVIETGLGGKYDGTNVVSRSDKLAVLTKIGLDHVAILGKTLPEITLQKAMIINKNSQAISINQDPKAEEVIREIAEEKKAKLFFIGRDGA